MQDAVPMAVRAALMFVVFALLGRWDVRRRVRRGADDVGQRSLAYRVIIGCGLAGAVFGVCMDQVTVTISPDYFRVFKEIPAETEIELRLGAANLGFAAGTIPGLIAGVCFAAAVTLNTVGVLATSRVLSFLLVPLMCFVVLAPVLGWYQAANDPAGVRDALRLGSESRMSRLLFVWGVHQAAYVAGLVGTIAATIVLRRRVDRLEPR